MESLRRAGLKRRWLAGAPSDDVEEGWIQQLEFFKEEADTWQHLERIYELNVYDLHCIALCYI